MKVYLAILATMFLAGGCDPAPVEMPDMKGDMKGVTMDMTGVSAGNIGDPCLDTPDCKEGTGAVCWKKRLFNKNMYLPVRDGYCTAPCTDDTQCGAAGTCTDFGMPEGKWCLKTCMAAADCRTPGYACFDFGPVCFPDGNLSCDPTMDNGRCPAGTEPTDLNGGCLRNAVGTGKTGRCELVCPVGTGTCDVDQDGDPQICIVVDETRNLDGTKTQDKFIGAVCNTKVKTPPPIANNLDCLYTPTGETMGRHYIDVCNDGYECYIKGMGTGGGFDSTGDDKCRQLCYQGGVAPPLPDGGVAGGMNPAPCTGGTPTCKDVWGLFATPLKIGLCVP